MASLVSTVVNYSISLGLCFSGTAEVYLNNGGRTKADTFAGTRRHHVLELALRAWVGC